MHQAMLLTSNNIAMLAPMATPAMLNDFRLELEANTEDGIKTYVTIQDFDGMKPGMPMIAVYSDYEFASRFEFMDCEIADVFMEICIKY